MKDNYHSDLLRECLVNLASLNRRGLWLISLLSNLLLCYCFISGAISRAHEPVLSFPIPRYAFLIARLSLCLMGTTLRLLSWLPTSSFSHSFVRRSSICPYSNRISAFFPRRRSANTFCSHRGRRGRGRRHLRCWATESSLLAHLCEEKPRPRRRCHNLLAAPRDPRTTRARKYLDCTIFC
jgi:hypothetical protein